MCLLTLYLLTKYGSLTRERIKYLKEEKEELEFQTIILEGKMSNIEEQIAELQEQYDIKNSEKLFLDLVTENLRASYKSYNDELYNNYTRYRNILEEEKKEKLNRNKLEIDEQSKQYFESVQQQREIAAQNLLLMEEKLLLLQKTERIIQEEKLNREENKNKNKLNINEKFQQQIRGLWAVCDQLPNPLPLFKAIYDIYFRTEVSDLVNRTAASSKTGIYKITNTTNDRIYIGQSTNIADRWKQHIKRGTGAEKGTLVGEKLYRAMFEDGIWNFSFEILEVVENKDDLNEREKYWINYFSAKEFGYNMKN